MAQDNYFVQHKELRPELNGVRSRITPVEAAVRLDLNNVVFVWENTSFSHCQRGTSGTLHATPMPCYPMEASALAQYMLPLASPFFKQVVYSVSGGGVSYPSGYTDKVLAALPSQPNSAGVLFDDFVYNEMGLSALQKMSSAVGSMGKDVFLCLYTHELLKMGRGLLPYLTLAHRPVLFSMRSATCQKTGTFLRR